MTEFVKKDSQVYAIIIRSDYSKNGTKFFSPENHAQQLGHINKSENHIIEPHEHPNRERKIKTTQETLFVRTGKLEVEIFDEERESIKEINLNEGDVVLLAKGGHSIRIIEDADIVIVKQGPYSKEEDKKGFE